MSYIVTIDGTAGPSIHSVAVIEASRRVLRRKGFHLDTVVARNLPIPALSRSPLDSSALEAAQCLIDQAQGVILVTSCRETPASALWQTLLSALPQSTFQERAILPILLGESGVPCRSVDGVLKPFLASLGAGPLLRPLSIKEAQIQVEHGGRVRLEEGAAARLQDSLEAVIDASNRIAAGYIDRQALAGSLLSSYL